MTDTNPQQSDRLFVPPAADGLPLAALDSATQGADRLDAMAITPYGRNLLAHALVQLARDGWLRTASDPLPASAPVSPAPADWIALRDRVAVVLAEADGWEYAKGLGLRDMSESMQQHYDKLADAVVAVLPEPADRAAILREAADAIEEAQHLRDDTVNEALGFLDHNTEQQHKAVHRSSALLRRLAAAASGSCGVAGETQHPETPAPADPRSIDYHQVSPARLNPAVCICGLGPDAAIHNEPPHQFNSRLKASHHAAVHGICTDCHHHESAACHTAAVSQPDEEA
jgi:hypothetical protein